MSTATITLKDNGEGSVDVTLDFGEAGTDDNSKAHHMAVAMIRSQTGGRPGAQHEGDSDE